MAHGLTMCWLCSSASSGLKHIKASCWYLKDSTIASSSPSLYFHWGCYNFFVVMHFLTVAIVVGFAATAFTVVVPRSHAIHEKRDATAAKKWVKRGKLSPDTRLPMRVGLKQRNLHRGLDFLMDVYVIIQIQVHQEVQLISTDLIQSLLITLSIGLPTRLSRCLLLKTPLLTLFELGWSTQESTPNASLTLTTKVGLHSMLPLKKPKRSFLQSITSMST